jgi:hypothetical protein
VPWLMTVRGGGFYWNDDGLFLAGSGNKGISLATVLGVFDETVADIAYRLDVGTVLFDFTS